MQIDIEYEASWRNSFLDGSNDEMIPKTGRKYIASITSLKTQGNYIKREVTKNTVMGLLNRLIGEQKKLYQARSEQNYYFKDIESLVAFDDKPEFCNEIVFLRNISGSTDQNSFTGMIKTSDPMFTSDYSKEFWGILALDFDKLTSFIIDDCKIEADIALDPISISDRFDEIGKIKALDKTVNLEKVLLVLDQYFPETNYLNKKEQIVPLTLYCSCLYLQYKRLLNKYDMSLVLTKQGKLSGISKRGFTKKGFMARFTTGKEKKIFGNPYMKESFVKGEGKSISTLSKANGILEIILDLPREKAKELKLMIENAGVSSFYLGKKGLAYVTNISTREVQR
ncbi:MAG: hypothetical protein COB17_01995 [Sulfurimonas sp.]|nr:MAG: hypothetical protein COB17_01995 [Sulfurimonas sp.]